MAARLTSLRPLVDADAPALAELRVRNRAFFEPWEPTREESWYTLESARRTIAEQRAARREDRGHAFGIFVPELVGWANLSAVVRGVFQNAYLGYAVDEASNGRGHATAAVVEAVRLAFTELGLHRVQAAVIPRNLGSLRVLEKAGFRREGHAERYLRINGVWEDHVLFARTSDDLPVR